jgi:hypothetical protein
MAASRRDVWTVSEHREQDGWELNDLERDGWAQEYRELNDLEQDGWALEYWELAAYSFPCGCFVRADLRSVDRSYHHPFSSREAQTAGVAQ